LKRLQSPFCSSACLTWWGVSSSASLSPQASQSGIREAAIAGKNDCHERRLGACAVTLEQLGQCGRISRRLECLDNTKFKARLNGPNPGYFSPCLNDGPDKKKCKGTEDGLDVPDLLRIDKTLKDLKTFGKKSLGVKHPDRMLAPDAPGFLPPRYSAN